MVQTAGMPGSNSGMPAMSADQINAAMGFNPNAAQFNPWANSPGGFGGLTDYYSSLGAAYGRQTGGFGAAPSGMPEWQYNQMMKASPSGSVERGSDLPAPDTSNYNALTGQTWGPQPAYNTYNGGANPGGFSPSPNYVGDSPSNQQWEPDGNGGVRPVSGGGGIGSDAGQAPGAMFDTSRYSQMYRMPEANPGNFNPGSYAGDRSNYGLQYNGQPLPGDIGFTSQSPMPNQGYNPGMEQWFANPGMNGGAFQGRFGLGFPGAGTPSQYGPGADMPDSFSRPYSVDNPGGALNLWGPGGSYQPGG
jgi:hypothetical protein